MDFWDHLTLVTLITVRDYYHDGSADVFLDLNPITSAIGGVKGMV
jgi:hypothetical protein